MSDEWRMPSAPGLSGAAVLGEQRLQPLSRLLHVMALIGAALWFLALAYILVDVSQGNGFPLMRKFFPFEDITIYGSRFQLYHSPAFFQAAAHGRHGAGSPVAFAYPPAAALVYAAFYAVGTPQTTFVILLVLWMAISVAGGWLLLTRYLPSRTLTIRYLTCLSAFTFPLLFLVERGNIELLVWMTLTVAIWLCLRGQATASAVMIGCAASVKLYPIFLLGLFLARARSNWKAVGAGVLAALLATVVAVAYAGPTFGDALYGFVGGVAKFNHQHAEAPRRSEAVFDHSLFSPVKIAYLGTHDAPQQWTTVYFAVAGLLALGIFWFRMRDLPLLNRLVFLSTAMILLPPVSYEYTVVHLYLPLLLMLTAATAQLHFRRLTSDGLVSAITCVLCAMLPLGLLQGGNFLYAGVVQLLALLLLVFFSTRAPWEMPSN